jgi:thiamine kinase-like enzyme
MTARNPRATIDCQRVRDVIGRHAALLHLDPTGVIVHGPIRRSRYSDVFKAEIPGLATALAVKCFLDGRTGTPDSASASAQFRALRLVNDSMKGGGDYRVPQPHFLAAPEGITAIEWIAARSMTDAILSGAVSLSDATDLMRRAAQWLRHFVNAGPKSSGPLNVEERFGQIDSVERALSRFDAARDACAALRKHAVPASAHTLEHSWLHGDFKTDNLLIDRTSVVGIDLHVKHVNAVVHDVGAFLNHWELTLCHPLAWRWRRWNDRLAHVFLETFDGAYLRQKRLPYAWTALYLMLGNWNEFSSRERSTLRHAYLRRCFSSIVRRRTRQIDMLAGNGSR